MSVDTGSAASSLGGPVTQTAEEGGLKGEFEPWTSGNSMRAAFLGPLASLYHHGNNEIPETPLQIEQAKIAKDQYADYQKRWSPVITYYKNRTDKGLGFKKQLAAGEANTDIQSKFGQAGDALSAGLRSRGVETGSGKDVAARAKLSSSKAAALGGGLALSQDAVDQQYENAIQSIVGIGRGERVQANQALGTVAGLSGEQAGANAQAAAQDAAGLGQALGVGLGGAAAYGLSPRGAKAPTPGSPTGLSQYTPPADAPTVNSNYGPGGVY